MDYTEFIKALSSPYSWGLALLVGILANVLSYSLKGLFDSTLGAVSERWRTAQAAYRDTQARMIADFASDDIRLLLFSHTLTRNLLTVAVLWALFFLALPNVTPASLITRPWYTQLILYASPVFVLAYALKLMRWYERRQYILEAAIAERQRRKIVPPNELP
jgi:hypothetical protein